MPQVDVQLVCGRKICVEIDASDTVHAFKHQVQQQIGPELTPKRQRVIVSGKEVEDYELMSDHLDRYEDVNMLPKYYGTFLFRQLLPISRSVYPDLKIFLPAEQVCSLICGYLSSEQEMVPRCDADGMMSYQTKYCPTCAPTELELDMRLYPKDLGVICPKYGEQLVIYSNFEFDFYFLKLDDSLFDLSHLTADPPFEAKRNSDYYIKWEQFCLLLSSDAKDDQQSVRFRFLCSIAHNDVTGDYHSPVELPRFCPDYHKKNYYLLYKARKRKTADVPTAPDEISVTLCDLKRRGFRLICIDYE